MKAVVFNTPMTDALDKLITEHEIAGSIIDHILLEPEEYDKLLREQRGVKDSRFFPRKLTKYCGIPLQII